MSAMPAERLSPTLQRYRAAFEQRFGARACETRRDAFEAFAAHGFPTPRDEAWKYTNLRRLESRVFQLNEPSTLVPPPENFVRNAGVRVVIVNGHWSAASSSDSVLPPGVTVAALGPWLAREPQAIDRIAREGIRETALERLNLAFCEDGVLIELNAHAQPDQPIYIVHQCSAQAAGRMSHPRVVICAGAMSRCTIIEHYLGHPDAEYFTNAVTSVEVAEGARLQHYRIQQEAMRAFHLGQLDACVQKDARYTLHDLALGANLGRLDAAARLEGSGAHVSMHGLFTPEGAQHLDAHTRIEHAAPHTTSFEDYRGVAAGRGRGVFNGKILVQPGAQKIEAQQSSRNLLLAPTAEIDAKPELEIYANDVKCSHGATTGQLDATALFYLRSRGVPENEARALLVRAFAETILTSITYEPLREHLERELNGRFALPGETP